MKDWRGQSVCVIGLGVSGRAAADLLLAQGARVTAIDDADTPELRELIEPLQQRGAECHLGGHGALSDNLDLGVISPGVPPENPIVESLRERGIPIWSELELGWRESPKYVGITLLNLSASL